MRAAPSLGYRVRRVPHRLRWLVVASSLLVAETASARHGDHRSSHSSHAPRAPHAPHAAKPVAEKNGWASPDEAYVAGVEAFNNGDEATAAAALQFYTTKAPKPDPAAFFTLGRALGKLARYPEAKEALSQFLKLVPQSDQADTVAKLLHDYDTLAATRFELTSTPEGASFTVDTPTGPSAKAPGELHAEPGAHKLLVNLAGYEPQTLEATIEAGQSAPVSVVLTPIGCDLRVEVATPSSSATVKVDDGSSENLGAPVRIRPGKHKVEIAPAGGEITARAITCEKTEPLQMSIVTQAPANGRISIQLPPGAKMILDGKEEKPTEGTRAIVELPPGEHLVDVEAEGKISWHAATLVHAGETTDLVPNLEAGGGATGIEVRTDPADADIVVDGKKARPGEMVRVSSGKRKISVHARGYFPEEREVDVLTGERSHLDVRLERRGRYLLWLGLGAIPVALAAEGLAILGHVNAGNELAGSPPFERWHALEVSGHVVAGAAALIAAGSITGYLLQGRSGEEPKTRVGAALDSHGGFVLVTRNF